MFKTVMVPIDLVHVDKLERALAVAADIARVYGATIYYVGVAGTSPGPAAHSPEEFTAKLEKLAAQQAKASGVDVRAKTVISHDVSVELDDVLRRTCQELAADLVVMGSHVPGFADYVFSSHGGSMASHAEVSVMIVR